MQGSNPAPTPPPSSTWPLGALETLEGRVERPDYALHVVELGSDVPLLFLHEAAGSAEAHLGRVPPGLLPSLAARGLRVIAFDLPGHGDSGREQALPDRFLERCADDAQAVLDALGIAAAPIFGLGVGGLIGLELARREPRRVPCVVIDSLPQLVPWIPAEPWPIHTQDDTVRAWQQHLAREPLPEHSLAALSSVRCPTLLLACGDPEKPQAAALARAVEGLSRCRVSILPGSTPPVSAAAAAMALREVERFLAAYA